MEGVLTGLEALELKFDQDTGVGLHQIGVADRNAAGILELGGGEVGGESRSCDSGGRQYGAACRQKIEHAHDGSPAYPGGDNLEPVIRVPCHGG